MRISFSHLCLLLAFATIPVLHTPSRVEADTAPAWKCSPSAPSPQSLPALWLHQPSAAAPYQGMITTTSDVLKTYFREARLGTVWYWRTDAGRSYAFLLEPDGRGLYYDFSKRHFFSQTTHVQPQYQCQKETR